MQNPNLSLNNSNVGKAYEDFMKTANTLNNELDEFLTDLDSQYKEVEYPHIDLANKRNHNPEFEQYYGGKLNKRGNKQNNRMQGGALTGTHFEGVSTRNIIASCREYNLTNSRNRITCIDAIIDARPIQIQHQILYDLGIVVPVDSSSDEEDVLSRISFGDDSENDEGVNESGLEEYQSILHDIHNSFNVDDKNEDDLDEVDFGDYNEVEDDVNSDDYHDFYSVESDEDDSNNNQVHPDDDNDDVMSQVTIDNHSQDTNDQYEKEIVTNHLKLVANQISNMYVQFSNALQPNFKQLSQSKVTSIADIFQQLKPKMQELLSDEFIHKFHTTQTKAISTSFDKLYTIVIIATKSFVKNTSDGGFLQQRRHNHINERYHL